MPPGPESPSVRVDRFNEPINGVGGFRSLRKAIVLEGGGLVQVLPILISTRLKDHNAYLLLDRTQSSDGVWFRLSPGLHSCTFDLSPRGVGGALLKTSLSQPFLHRLRGLATDALLSSGRYLPSLAATKASWIQAEAQRAVMEKSVSRYRHDIPTALGVIPRSARYFCGRTYLYLACCRWIPEVGSWRPEKGWTAVLNFSLAGCDVGFVPTPYNHEAFLARFAGVWTDAGENGLLTREGIEALRSFHLESVLAGCRDRTVRLIARK